MGGPVFSDIYMTKVEKDAILPPRKPKLYKRFVDDIFPSLSKTKDDIFPS